MLHFVRLDGERLAASDGRCTIWLDPRQRQAQRRCSLAHELEHLARGHHGCQPPAIEREVEEAAARVLITLDDLLAALAWTSDPAELAEELSVDAAMLSARLRGLTLGEAGRAAAVIAAREAGA